MIKKYLQNLLVKTNDKYRCSVCLKKVDRFKPLSSYYYEMEKKYQFAFKMKDLETFNIRQFTCPKCGARDTIRLIALYILPFLNENPNLSVIDFAPDERLRRAIKKFKNIQYRTADLYREDVDDQVDLTNLTIFQDESFDCFICSHILEHISDDVQAMKELYRITKPNGFGIVMVPLLLTLKKSLEDPEHTTDAERWKYYGQFDHVRMYSQTDFINKLKQVGFSINKLGIDYFGKDTFMKHGITPTSILYVVHKEL